MHFHVHKKKILLKEIVKKKKKKKKKISHFLKCISNTTKHIQIRRPEEVGSKHEHTLGSMEFSESDEQLFLLTDTMIKFILTHKKCKNVINRKNMTCVVLYVMIIIISSDLICDHVSSIGCYKLFVMFLRVKEILDSY